MASSKNSFEIDDEVEYFGGKSTYHNTSPGEVGKVICAFDSYCKVQFERDVAFVLNDQLKVVQSDLKVGDIVEYTGKPDLYALYPNEKSYGVQSITLDNGDLGKVVKISPGLGNSQIALKGTSLVLKNSDLKLVSPKDELRSLHIVNKKDQIYLTNLTLEQAERILPGYADYDRIISLGCSGNDCFGIVCASHDLSNNFVCNGCSFTGEIDYFHIYTIISKDDLRHKQQTADVNTAYLSKAF